MERTNVADVSIAPFLQAEFQGTFTDRPAGARHRFAAPRSSSALRDALTAIKLTPWYDEFVRYLRELRPRLDSIESIAVGDRDEPFMFDREPRVAYPVAYAGDGFRRALLLAAALAQAKGGVAALDEPEAFAHPKMLPALTRLFQRALGDGTQILVATYNLEFVAAVLGGLDGQSESAAVVGLSFRDGAPSPVVIAGPEAQRRVVELGDDLRL